MNAPSQFSSNKPESNPNLVAPPSEQQKIPVSSSETSVVVTKDPPKRSNSMAQMDPRTKDFDQEAYKRKMLEDYERQQQENAEVLRKKKEREMLGLPPIIEIPFVPERPRRSMTSAPPVEKNKKKKKKWWQLKK